MDIPFPYSVIKVKTMVREICQALQFLKSYIFILFKTNNYLFCSILDNLREDWVLRLTSLSILLYDIWILSFQQFSNR